MARSTLRHRLYSLVFLWVAALSVVAVVVTQSSLSRLEDAAIEERMLLGRSVAHSLDEQLAHLFGDLRQLSSQLRPPFRQHLDRLRALRFAIPFRRAIYVLDENGGLLASDPRSSEPIPSRWLEGRESVTPSLVGSPGSEPVAAIIQPFQTTGGLHYVVAEMEIGRDGLDTFLGGVTSSGNLRILLLDETGRVLAANEPGTAKRQLPPSEVARLAASRAGFVAGAKCYLCAEGDSEDVLTVVVPLDLAPWSLVVQQDARQVFSGARWSRVNLYSTLVLVALTGVFLAWSLTRSVADPLRRLSLQAERLREGDLSGEIHVTADREITLLAETLDEARRRLAGSLDELRDMNETLEHQVRIRTREIRKLLERTLDEDAKRRILVRRLLSAGEEERRRIARELHDEIAQLLTVVVLALERIPHEDRRIVQAQEVLARTQSEIKRIISDLRPSLLDDLGLSMAVRGHANDFLVSRGLAVNLEVEEDLSLSSEIETTAFRIYQELATNVVRHSGAEHVAIELYVDRGRLTLSVEDDGAGFVPEERAGTGIIGMHERADLVGGTIRIESAPGTGTHVRFECPAAAPLDDPADSKAGADQGTVHA
jgi:signal transduction histidine kinase